MTAQTDNLEPPERCWIAVRDLWRALVIARVKGQEPEQYAVELPKLEAAGLTENELRLLIDNGIAQSLEEQTQIGDSKRRFTPIMNLAFFERTCLILTEQGERVVARLAINRDIETAPVSEMGNLLFRYLVTSIVPKWYKERRELLLGAIVLRRFYQASAAQEAILDWFEENRWKNLLPNPFLQDPDGCAKERLQSAVKKLNKSLAPGHLRFITKHGAQFVGWKLEKQ